MKSCVNFSHRFYKSQEMSRDLKGEGQNQFAIYLPRLTSYLKG